MRSVRACSCRPPKDSFKQPHIVKRSCKSSWSQTRTAPPNPPLTKGRSICFSLLSASGVPERRHAPGFNRNPTAPLKLHKSVFFFSSTRWAIGCHLERCLSSLFPLNANFCSIFCTELIISFSAWKFLGLFYVLI